MNIQNVCIFKRRTDTPPQKKNTTWKFHVNIDCYRKHYIVASYCILCLLLYFLYLFCEAIGTAAILAYCASLG
jgi:hypothetical protein